LKLSVIIPSRGRPLRLKGTLDVLRSLESKRHDIRYVIGADSDDPETIGMAHMLRLGDPRVSLRCFVRLGSLGEMVNRMAADNPADVYVSLWEAKPDGVWWWKTLAVRPATYAIVSEKWRKAAGRIFTDYFPFWWDDMWLLQVWLMASNGPLLAIEASLDDQAQATHRMRDLRRWSDFYTSRKGERCEQAARIAKALGWPEPYLKDDVCDVSEPFLREIANIEAMQGEKTPPTPEYLKALQRAEALMAA
jgi:hypothetical protein